MTTSRDIPKQKVAEYIHSVGLLPILIEAAASNEPYKPAAMAIIDAIMSSSITYIDLDLPEYIQGISALLAYGIIEQRHIDDIEALYVTPLRDIWEYVRAVRDRDSWLVVISNGKTEEAIRVMGSETVEPELLAQSILSQRNI